MMKSHVTPLLFLLPPSCMVAPIGKSANKIVCFFIIFQQLNNDLLLQEPLTSYVFRKKHRDEHSVRTSPN